MKFLQFYISVTRDVTTSDFVIAIDIALFCTTDFKSKKERKSMIKRVLCFYVNMYSQFRSFKRNLLYFIRFFHSRETLIRKDTYFLSSEPPFFSGRKLFEIILTLTGRIQ